jgi:hypothetical protein
VAERRQAVTARRERDEDRHGERGIVRRKDARVAAHREAAQVERRRALIAQRGERWIGEHETREDEKQLEALHAVEGGAVRDRIREEQSGRVLHDLVRYDGDDR